MKNKRTEKDVKERIVSDQTAYSQKTLQGKTYVRIAKLLQIIHTTKKILDKKYYTTVAT